MEEQILSERIKELRIEGKDEEKEEEVQFEEKKGTSFLFRILPFVILLILQAATFG